MTTPPEAAAPGEPRPVAPRGLYAVGSAGLGIQALVLLLAAPAAAAVERGHVSAPAIGVLLGLAVLLIVAAARLRKPGGKAFGGVLQVACILSGAVIWPMYVVGLAFGGLWLYWLRQWHLPA